MSKRLWSVNGAVVGGTHLGEFEAETAEEAIKLAIEDFGSIPICHQCSRYVEDIELDEESLRAEPMEPTP